MKNMKIIAFTSPTEITAILTNSCKPLALNKYKSYSYNDIYDWAKVESEKRKVTVDIEWRKG